MSRRGRPKNDQPSVHLAIAGWLHSQYDADIIAWYQAIPKGERMKALKTALRSGGFGLETDNNATEQAQAAAEAILSHWEF